MHLNPPAEVVPTGISNGVYVADNMVDSLWYCILALQIHPRREMHDIFLLVCVCVCVCVCGG